MMWDVLRAASSFFPPYDISAGTLPHNWCLTFQLRKGPDLRTLTGDSSAKEGLQAASTPSTIFICLRAGYQSALVAGQLLLLIDP